MMFDLSLAVALYTYVLVVCSLSALGHPITTVADGLFFVVCDGSRADRPGTCGFGVFFVVFYD